MWRDAKQSTKFLEDSVSMNYRLTYLIRHVLHRSYLTDPNYGSGVQNIGDKSQSNKITAVKEVYFHVKIDEQF